MGVFWLIASAIFGLLSVVLLTFVAITLKAEGRVEYRAIGAALLGIGAIMWCISIKNHPEDWLDAEGHSKRSFRFRR